MPREFSKTTIIMGDIKINVCVGLRCSIECCNHHPLPSFR